MTAESYKQHLLRNINLAQLLGNEHLARALLVIYRKVFRTAP